MRQWDGVERGLYYVLKTEDVGRPHFDLNLPSGDLDEDQFKNADRIGPVRRKSYSDSLAGTVGRRTVPAVEPL